MNTNLKAFLDMIAWSEGSTRIPGSDDGYNVLVGSTPKRPIFFSSYAVHPDVYNPLFNSTAAGRYQIIFPTWEALTVRLNLLDFTPPTQDAMGASLISQDCGAADMVAQGDLASAIEACAQEWASLPGSDSGQYENTMDALADAYTGAGGTLA